MKKIKFCVNDSISIEPYFESPYVEVEIPEEVHGYEAHEWLRENDPEQIEEIEKLLEKLEKAKEKIIAILEEANIPYELDEGGFGIDFMEI